jgi:hypothetical protein
MLLNRWGGSAANWLKDWSGNGYNFSVNGTVTETAGGFLLSQTTPTHRIFQGSTDFLRRITNLHPRLNNFYIGVGIKTPASLSGFKVIGNARTEPQGHSVHTNNTDFAAAIISGSVGIAAKVTVEANKFYYGTWRFRRDGNVTCLVFGPDGLLTDTTDISSYSAVDINNASDYFIGTYAPIVTSSEWDGGLVFYKYIKDDTLTDKQIYEDFFLATGWKSGGGNVYRNSFGFHQMVLNTGKDVLTVGLKGGTQSAMDIITSDSTRYTMQFSGITSLSSDSLIFVAGGDSVWHALSDSTFAANRGLQVVFDAWTSTRFTAPTGDWATIDNITVSTYALAPEISVNPTSYNYGDITVNDSDSVYVKIINTGDGDLSVTDIVPQDADLVTLSATSFTISSNDSDSVLVKIFPTATGTVYDTLTITNNDADEGSLEVPLEVNGLALPSSSTVEEKRKLVV